MARFVKVSVISLEPFFKKDAEEGKLKEYIKNKIKENIEKVLCEKPDLIVLPEYCDMIYAGNKDEISELCKDNKDVVLEMLKNIAKKNHCYISYPTHVRLEDGTARNTVSMIDRNGEVIGIYNKNYLVISETESLDVLCGKTIPVFECDFGRVCPLICFDLNFEENRKRIKELGPDITMFNSHYHGSFLQNFFAYETRSYFVSAICNNESSIISPVGEKLSSTTNYFNYTTYKINLDYAVCHLDYNIDKFKAAKEKYGEKISIDIPKNLGAVLLTSNTDEFTVKDIILEFGIEIIDDYMERSRKHKELNTEK